jgi:hypothetical protein
MDPITARLPAHIHDRLEAMADDQHDGKRGAAMRRCLDEGLRQHGYGDSGPDGYWRTVGRELAKALLWTGAALFVATIFTPLAWQFQATACWLLCALLVLVSSADLADEIPTPSRADGGGD